MRRRLAASVLAFAVLAASAVLAAKHKPSAPPPSPAHNYVRLDLTWPAPGSMSPGRHFAYVYLIDAASVARHGDAVHYDVLSVSPTMLSLVDGTEVAQGDGTEERSRPYSMSCGWRTTGSTGAPFFITAPTGFGALAERACANRPLNAEKGARSAADAGAMFKDQFSEPGQMPPTLVMGTPHSAPSAPWALTDTPHKFVVVFQSGGRLLLIDKASLARDGDTVEGLSLAVLAPSEQHSALTIAVMRKMSYACTPRTMTIQASQGWSGKGYREEASDTPFAPMRAADAPVTAAETAAACNGLAGVDATTSFADFADVQTFQESSIGQ